ncbi:MAG: sigma-70 family RNA polymerase sigma factor [Planctomycetota bacterium]
MADSDQKEYSRQIQAAVGGDRDVLLRLLLDVQHELGQFVVKKIRGNRALRISTEDILQEVYIRVFREVKKLRAENRTGFLAWLKTIAANQIIDSARHQAAAKRGGDRAQVINDENVFSDRALDLISQFPDVHGNSPSQFAACREAVDAMSIALAKLPKDQREAVRLHFFEKLSLKDTAERMDRTWDSVRGLIQRAKLSLRDSMQSSTLWLSKKG